MIPNTIKNAISASLLKETTSYDISLEPVCKAHLTQLARTLRQKDKEEIAATYGWPVEKALLYCWQSSWLSWALLYRGEVVAVAGLQALNLLGQEACMWLWTGEGIRKCPFSFFKISRRLIACCQQYYPYLYALCDERYHAAHRYLKRLGGVRQNTPYYLADKHIRFYIYHFAPCVQNNYSQEEFIWEEQ